MKKFLSVLLSVVILLAFTACTEKNNQNSDEISTITTHETHTEKENENNTKGPASSEEILKNSVDYSSSSFGDWCYSSTYVADALIDIETINSLKRGTAGSSYSEAAAGICALNLSSYEGDICELLEIYMRDMTAIQKDYFSLNWEDAVNTASRCFEDNGKEVKNTMSDFSPENFKNFNMNNYSKDKLKEMDKKANKFFKKEGIAKEWRNLPEFFFD